MKLFYGIKGLPYRGANRLNYRNKSCWDIITTLTFVYNICYFCHILTKIGISTNFSKNLTYEILRKNPSVWACRQAGRQAGVTKLTVAFCNCFVKAPKNASIFLYLCVSRKHPHTEVAKSCAPALRACLGTEAGTQKPSAILSYALRGLVTASGEQGLFTSVRLAIHKDGTTAMYLPHTDAARLPGTKTSSGLKQTPDTHHTPHTNTVRPDGEATRWQRNVLLSQVPRCRTLRASWRTWIKCGPSVYLPDWKFNFWSYLTDLN
jgi:hypothetical protein